MARRVLEATIRNYCCPEAFAAKGLARLLNSSLDALPKHLEAVAVSIARRMELGCRAEWQAAPRILSNGMPQATEPR